MIATETPLLLAKATEAFIADLTVRAFASEIETGMRRTLQVCKIILLSATHITLCLNFGVQMLQKADIAKATGKTDMFDFLIDILPRETKPTVAVSRLVLRDMDGGG
jgi:nuclear transcription factor Y gamma